ncbi:MAG: plasmid mobilization protein [Eubacterium sp.]
MFLLSATVQVSVAVKEVNIYNSEVKEIEENRKRDKTLTIRLTDSEKKKIIAKARKTKMSATDFIIASTDNAVIKTPEDLRPVVSQLKRIGNNINQIAVKVNSGAVYSVNFDEVIDMQNKIYEKVFEIANADSQIH